VTEGEGVRLLVPAPFRELLALGLGEVLLPTEPPPASLLETEGVQEKEGSGTLCAGEREGKAGVGESVE